VNRLSTLIFHIFLLAALLAAQASRAADCVVLLHGLGRTAHSMNDLEESLRANNYLVVNNSYSSREKTIAELSSIVGDGIAACKNQHAEHIHFVTHSLGGILVRHYFQTHTVAEAKRVVMLGPPNRGSEVATKYKNEWWYQWFTGPAGQELGVDETSVPNILKPIPLEIGIIAGTESLDPWFSRSVPKPNDGKVSVESAKLDNMKDFTTVPHSHTFIANADIVVREVNIFLSQGTFTQKDKGAVN